MNNMLKKWNIKKIVISCVMALTMLSASFVGYRANFRTPVEASFKQEISLISNNEFANTTNTNTPATPSNWTPHNPTSSEKIKSGVINVYPTVFPNNAESYELEQNENPGTTEEGKTFGSDDAFYKHLMINSYEGANRANYTSNSFSLSKSSFYAINVIAKTIGDARASIYLKGLSDKEVRASIENFTTQGEWQQYTLFVSTNDYNSENVTLELWLGGENAVDTSTDAVFFNRVNTIRYSQSTYSLELYYANLVPSNRNRIVNVELNGTVNNSPVLNANFEEELGDTNIISGFKTLYNNVDENDQQALRVIPINNSYNASIHTEPGIVNPQSNNFPNNQQVLFMQNKTANYQGIESSDITIAKQTYYKLSVWAKSNSGIGNGATIKLVEKNLEEDIFNPDEEFTPVTASLTVSTSETTDATTNNWTKYSFYLEGHPLKDTVVNLQLWLGEQGKATEGYVFFDNIQMQQIRYSYYTAGSTSSNSKTFSFNANNNQFMVANGNFNLTNNATDDLVYPLVPRNWTLSTTDENFNSEDIISGIVNTQDNAFTAFQNELLNSSNINKRVAVSNPGLTPMLKTFTTTTANTANNVLVVGNPQETSHGYVSENITLSAGTYYKVSFAINTQFTQNNPNSGVSVKLATTNHTVYELVNINTNSEWKTYNIFISPKDDLTTSITLMLNNATGFAFFDDVMAVTVSEDIFNQAQANNLPNTFVANFNVEHFENYLHNNTVLNTPYLWKGNHNGGSEQVMFGIVDTNLLPSTELLDVANPNTNKGTSALLIGSTEDTNYTAISSTTLNFENSNYYKVSIWVKTLHIIQDEQNAKTDENGKAILPGASIKLSSFDETFKGINTQLQSSTNLNDWVEYVFYVHPENSVNTNVEISLGYTNALTSGYVFVDSIELTTMEKTAYMEAINSIGNSKTAFSLTALSTEEEPTTDDGKDFTGNKFDWLLVSSILTALTLLVAVLGTLLRRVNWNVLKPTKKVKTSYDRRRTLEVEMNKRERIEFRKNIISDLKLEFESIDQEIEDFIAQNNAKVDELKRKALERKQKFEAVSQAILIQITDVTKEHKAQLEQVSDEATKQKLVARYTKVVEALKAKDQKAKVQALAKEKKFEQLQARREKFLQQQQYRKQLIQEEIERIEREIEEIAREEEQMWSEYRKAKEEAKKAKMEYMATKRAEKRSKKTSHSDVIVSETHPTTSDDVIVSETHPTTSDDVIEVKDENKDNK